MMHNFKVGDILIGKQDNGYHYTNHRNKVRVTTVHTDGCKISVMLLKAVGPDSLGPWIVDAIKFRKTTRTPGLRCIGNLPRFVKAQVVDAMPGSLLIQDSIVILDMAKSDSQFAHVKGQVAAGGWYWDRFAIDATLPVLKKELING